MKSKRRFSIYFILCFLLVFNPSTLKASTIGVSSSDKFTVQEMQILNSLTTLENEIKLNFTNNQISNENGELEESSSPSFGKNSNKIKTSHLRTLLKEDPSLVQIQLFDTVSGNQIMWKTVKSLEELDGLTFETPEYILEENKANPVFQADYMVIVSTKDHVSFYNFSRFYINDLQKADTELLSGVLQYIQSEDLQNGLNLEFVKVEERVKDLDIADSKNSISCIACVGSLYTEGARTYFDRWVNVAQVHAIKGVDTTLSLSNSKTSTVSIQSKSVTPVGIVTSSGSLSNTLSSVTTFPKRTATSLTAKGTHAQQQVKMVKSEFTNIKTKARHTEVRRYRYIGGTNFGNAVGGNGKNFDSTSGSSYLPGSKYTLVQDSAQSFSTQASSSIYGVTVGVTVTLNTSSQNKWAFEFKTGQGYKWYKVYGKYKNLTAK